MHYYIVKGYRLQITCVKFGRFCRLLIYPLRWRHVEVVLSYHSYSYILYRHWWHPYSQNRLNRNIIGFNKVRFGQYLIYIMLHACQPYLQQLVKDQYTLSLVLCLQQNDVKLTDISSLLFELDRRASHFHTILSIFRIFHVSFRFGNDRNVTSRMLNICRLPFVYNSYLIWNRYCTNPNNQHQCDIVIRTG